MEDQVEDRPVDNDDPEGTHSEASDEAHSRRGSIAHPYRAFLNDASFARCHARCCPSGGTDTYTRSLSMSGNGIPVWEPIGNLNRPAQHLKSGIMIGDVGFLTEYGDFFSYFNIFLPPSSELQYRCPPGMEPLLPPPQPDDIKTNSSHFPSGTTLVSTGVEVARISESPLDLKFTVKARECGILVLPDGASREDLVSTTRIHDYIQKHALDWYIFFNGGRGDVSRPNGSLCIVTGCDKATTWATCTSGPSLLHQPNTSSNRYKDGNFQNSEMASNVFLAEYGAEKCAVFLRVMKVAVNTRDWTQYILLNEPPRNIPFYNMLAVPVLGIRARYRTLKEIRFHQKDKLVVRGGRQCIFHPLEVILHILLQETPTADVALAEDSMWCHLTNNSDGTITQTFELLIRILENHSVSTKDGVVTLVPVDVEETPQRAVPSRNFLLRIPSLIHEEYTARRQRRDIIHKIAKVFPGPSMPEECLKLR